MRKGRFTEEQMVAILRETDRTTVAEAAKNNKVSEPTIYAWRKATHRRQREACNRENLAPWTQRSEHVRCLAHGWPAQDPIKGKRFSVVGQDDG